MIPGRHQLKGGALQLGTDEPGLSGPVGAWTDQHGQEDERDPDEKAELHC